MSNWQSVRAKAIEIVDRDGVRLLRHDKDIIAAEVHSITGATYHPILYRQDSHSWALSMWECDCPWGDIRNPANPAIDRASAFLQGRLCSHGLATLYKAQAEEMFRIKELQS